QRDICAPKMSWDPPRVWAFSFMSQPEASPLDKRPCFDLFAEDEEVCYEAEIGNARFSLKYRRDKKLVMAGLVPAIHVFDILGRESWMPATSAGMTRKWGP